MHLPGKLTFEVIVLSTILIGCQPAGLPATPVTTSIPPTLTVTQAPISSDAVPTETLIPSDLSLGEIEAGNLEQLESLYTLSGYATAFHPQEKRIATGELTGRILLWDLLDGRLLDELTDVHRMVFDLDYSPDGNFLAAAYEAEASVIDAESGASLVTISGLGQLVQAVAFSPDGTWLAVGGSNGIRILRTTDWEEIAELQGHQGIVFDLDFTPDGTALVSAGGMPDSRVIVWKVENFEIQYELVGQAEGDVHSLAISPDSRFVVSGGTDRTAVLWDLSTGESLQRLSGYHDVIYGLTYSPAGNLIAAACGADGYMILWDTENTLTPFRLRDSGVEVLQVEFSPDGYYIAESNNQHQVVIWGLP